jgi:hypothetical protein
LGRERFPTFDSFVRVRNRESFDAEIRAESVENELYSSRVGGEGKEECEVEVQRFEGRRKKCRPVGDEQLVAIRLQLASRGVETHKPMYGVLMRMAGIRSGTRRCHENGKGPRVS